MSIPGESGGYPGEPPMPRQPLSSYARHSVTGGQLLSAAWSVISKDKELVALPVLSSIFAMIACLPFLGAAYWIARPHGQSAPAGVYTLSIIIMFFGTWAATTVSVFFQVALVSAVFERVEGGDPTIGSALAAAWRDIGRIIQWAFVASVVAFIIQLIKRRAGGVAGEILGTLAGIAWAVASLFVVPIIVAQGLGPIDAVKESAALIGRTWGKALRAGLRFGITQFLVMLVPFAVLLMGLGLVISGSTATVIGGGALIAIGILGFVCVGVFFSALGTALNAMLYRYAVGLPVPGIDEDLLANAFKVKA